MEGWIRLYRKVLDHTVFTSKDDKLFRTFIYCLLRANHKETVVEFNHQEIPLNPGEFITSREHAALDLGFGAKTFDRKIDDLLKLKILTRCVTRRYSIISIINWQAYQNPKENNDPLLDPQNDPLPDHRQEERKRIKTLRSNPDPKVKEFIDFWFQTFKEKFGGAYKITGGKEGNLIKSLLKIYSLDCLKSLANVFFKSTDPFIQKSGYTIGIFSSQINKLVVEETHRRSQW